MKNLLNKKGFKIGIISFIIIFLLIIVWLFIVPVFSNNKYGDRLKDIEKYPITNSTINKIKSSIKENDQVKSVTYHKEGRLLYFIIKVGDLSVDDAKKLTDKVTENISSKNQKYYDIQVLIDGDNDNYPISGYKSKNSKTFSFGNVNSGDSSE